MARGELGKSARINCDQNMARKGITAPISLEDLMEKEVQSPLQDGAIRELSVLQIYQMMTQLASSKRSAFWITLKT